MKEKLLADNQNMFWKENNEVSLFSILKHRAEIYGVCAIWIVIFHLYRRISMPFIPVITNIVSLGNMAVDVFLFLSGLSLFLSAEKNNYMVNGWKIYYKKRASRVLVPYLIVAIPYFLWAIIVEDGHHSVIGVLVRFIWNISSASFWLKGVQTTWYVYAISLFYILFPILYSYIKKENSIIRILVFLAGIYLFSIITNYTPILRNSTIAWSRLPIFVIGILFGKYTDKLDLSNVRRKKRKVLICLNVIFLLLSAWILSLNEIFDSFAIQPVYAWLLYGPMTISLMIVLSMIYEQCSLSVGLLRFIGGISLEIYLVHITLLHPMNYYGILKHAGNWNYLILPICSILISIGISEIANRILQHRRF